MAWWEWLLLAVLIGVLLIAAAYLVVRSTRRGRRFLALPIRGKLLFGRSLLSDPEIPWYAKGLVGITVIYLALPIDLIPDFIPVVGQLDDVLLVVLAIALLLLLVPGDRFDAALDIAAGQPTTWR